MFVHMHHPPIMVGLCVLVHFVPSCIRILYVTLISFHHIWHIPNVHILYFLQWVFACCLPQYFKTLLLSSLLVWPVQLAEV
jgi:hypothetical protein